MNPLLKLAEEWRSEAETLLRYSDERGASVCELHAQELEAAWTGWQSEELTIAQAATESGYTEDHLRQLVREGRIPDDRPQGSKAEIRVRRCDLPRKLRDQHQSVSVVEDMAMTLLKARR